MIGDIARGTRAVARLDLADLLRSRWLIFSGGVYGVLAAVFVFVGMRESAIMEFTGTGRVLLAFCHALVLLLPLLALTATAQVVNQARADGTLELLLSHPISRTSYFLGVSIVRYLSLVLPLCLLMVAIGLYGRVAHGQEIPWRFLLQAMVISASLLAAFVGLGLAISTLVRSQAKAMVALLLVWALVVALLDFGLIGLMLRWRLQPQLVFALATINPVQSARMALLSSAEPSLSVFGPVGFYLANRLGSAWLLGLGVAWPALVGLGAWSVALFSFRRGDMV